MTQVYKPGDRIFDRIEVLEYIGDGGVGQVYRTRLGADEYAVKVLDPDLVSPDADAKALRETLLRNVPVDTILVRVRGVRSDGKRMHIIEPFVQGKNLRDLIVAQKDSGRKFDPAQVFGFIDRLLSFMTTLPSAAVHGALKPENIHIADDNPQISSGSRVRVTDVNIHRILSFSKYASVQLERDEAYAYLAPEFVSVGGNVDRHADIYSIAVLAYELATGSVPGKDPKPLSEAGFDGPEALDEVIAQALSPDPAHRPNTMREFRRLLRAAYPDAAQATGVSSMQLSAVDVFTGEEEDQVQVDVTDLDELDVFGEEPPPPSTYEEPPAAAKPSFEDDETIPGRNLSDVERELDAALAGEAAEAASATEDITAGEETVFGTKEDLFGGEEPEPAPEPEPEPEPEIEPEPEPEPEPELEIEPEP
ncbi:protein kinase, partial [bacterium]|nr:protein kinase [bacterium]